MKADGKQCFCLFGAAGKLPRNCIEWDFQGNPSCTITLAKPLSRSALPRFKSTKLLIIR